MPFPTPKGKASQAGSEKPWERPGLSPAAEGEEGGGRHKGHQGLHPGIAPELGKLFRTEGRRGRDHDVGRGLKQAPLKRALKALHYGEHGEQGRHPKHEPSDAKHGQQGPAPAAAEGVKKAPAYPGAEGHNVPGRQRFRAKLPAFKAQASVEARGQGQIVGHHHQRRTLLFPQGEHQIDHLMGRGGIQIPRGFVGQEHGGLAHQGPSQSHPLPFPAGKGPRTMLTPAARPTAPRSRAASARASAFPSPRMSNGMATFSSAENSASRW